MKDGTEFILNSKSQTPTSLGKTADSKYRYEFYSLYIDINGSKTPNANGQDRFMVFVDTAGTIIPAGSKEASRYFEGSENYGTKKGYGIVVDCTDPNENPNAYCTGTIVKDGWVVNW